jgi:hypothetical protein
MIFACSFQFVLASDTFLTPHNRSQNQFKIFRALHVDKLLEDYYISDCIEHMQRI